jgi:hypothetical protein
MADLVEFLGRVDQRFGGNTANIETSAARLDGLHDDSIETELSGTDSADVSTGTGADNEELAGNLFH